MNLAPESLLLAVLLLPPVAALGILATGRHPNLREAVSLLASGLLFALVALLYRDFPANAAQPVTWLALLPGLTVSFSIEALGLLFALIASLLWFITTLYAIGYMRGHGEQHQTRFYGFFAISIGATMAIAFADNLFTLFLFYEVLTLCTYPLVTHAGTEKARLGGRRYLNLLIGTSIVFFLPALVATWAVAGTLTFTPGGVFGKAASPVLLSILLILFLFGIGKAAVMPFHRWLPSAMVAPTPVSALLHAVAVVKAGVFTVLKVAVYIIGIDNLTALPVQTFALYLLATGILLASLVAMRQDNLKARLAYSTISQLGYISLGALLATEAAVTGSALHILMHAFGKITLFFCAGAILVAHHKSEISEMQGLGRRMPITMAAFLVGSLSIIGLPPSGGLWSKWYLMLGSLEAQQWPLMAVLMLSSLLNIAYLLPIPLRAFFPAAGASPAAGSFSAAGASPAVGTSSAVGTSPPTGATPVAGIQEAPRWSLVALSLTAAICVVLFFLPQPWFELVEAIPRQTAE